MILLKQQLVKPELLDYDVLVIEDENKHSWTQECNNCHKTIWWNKCVRHRRTKRCLPLDSEYIPDTGMIPRRHQCMLGGVKKYINKYENKGNEGNFFRDNVVKDKDNQIMKQAKIDRYNKLTGYGLAERMKTVDDYYKKWREYTFAY